MDGLPCLEPAIRDVYSVSVGDRSSQTDPDGSMGSDLFLLVIRSSRTVPGGLTGLYELFTLNNVRSDGSPLLESADRISWILGGIELGDDRGTH